MTLPAEPTGFSLIEALVALAILAVAAVGLIRASEAHVDSVRGLERRAAARWVAENRLAELSVVGLPSRDGDVEMLGYRWRITTGYEPTEDPDLRKARIAIRAEGDTAPSMILEGFVDRGRVK